MCQLKTDKINQLLGVKALRDVISTTGCYKRDRMEVSVTIYNMVNLIGHTNYIPYRPRK